MNESILEAAASNAIDTLNVVTTANTYWTDATVERELKDGNPPRDGLFVCRVGDVAPKPGAPLGFDEYLVPVQVDCYSLPVNADTTPVSTALSRMAADVRRALMIDPHRGGYAIHTQFTSADNFHVTEPPFFVRVTAFLWCRTRLGNPYLQS